MWYLVYYKPCTCYKHTLFIREIAHGLIIRTLQYEDNVLMNIYQTLAGNRKHEEGCGRSAHLQTMCCNQKSYRICL